MPAPDTDLNDRIEKCLAILKKDPDSQIFASLAECYRKKGDLDKAYEIGLNGIQRHFEYGTGHLVMAKINLDKKDYRLAQEELNLAERYMGRTRSIDYLQCEILLRGGELKKGEILLSQLKITEPQNPAIRFLTGLLNKAREQNKKRPHAFDSTDDSEENEVNGYAGDADNLKDEKISVEFMVKTIGSYQGVNYVLALDYDNNVLSAYPPAEECMDDHLHFCRIISQGLNHCLPSVGFGKMGSCLVETDKRKYFLKDAGSFYLLLDTDDNSNFGFLSMKLAEMLPYLENKGQ
ncbi:MAG: hypothetical protein GF307_05025 [candidate division Zixibacteria bacterium]|nr:hypothetical protein [candidate division Zixibacteria bacterium]